MKRNILLIIFILVLIYLIWKQFSTDQYGYNEPEEHDNVYLTEDDVLIAVQKAGYKASN